MLGKIPVGTLEEFGRSAIVGCKCLQHDLRHLVGLAMVGKETGLVIERIDVRDAASHVQENHAPRARRKMGCAGKKRVGSGRGARSVRKLRSEAFEQC